MPNKPTLLSLTATLTLIFGAAAMAQIPASNAATRTLDRAAGTDTSGAYPAQKDGTPANPPGTAAGRTLDRAAGTNNSGAYPQQADGTKNNPRGTAVSRTAHRVKHKAATVTQ